MGIVVVVPVVVVPDVVVPDVVVPDVVVPGMVVVPVGGLPVLPVLPLGTIAPDAVLTCQVPPKVWSPSPPATRFW